MTSKYDRYSKEELVKIIEERDRKPRLGLVWERDEIDHDRSLNQDFVTLDLLSKHSCGDGPWHNLLIEGDNFDALRYLRMTHANRVKCIYIDPPYNTGNKDFIYNDRFVDKDDAWKHSKWLEYLYRRLLLARDLLAEDGVLLVSINDENRAKLELLLDQALPGMQLGSFVWRTRQGSNADHSCFLSTDHEHVLVYGGPGFRFIGFGKSYEMYGNQDDDPKGDWRPSDLTLGFSFQERPNLYYPLRDPNTDIYYPPNPDRVWVYATEARLKPGQSAAKDNVLEIFRYANAQLDGASDPDSRRAASAHNGCVLIQAPTGAGKTLIAGLVAEEFAKETNIVWLWFTPFAGLVEQARISIKNHFQGLRVRDIGCDRVAHSSRSGDVFVTTWAAVAGRKDSKRLRRDGDLSVSLDHLLGQLRQRGFKIGVLVDEAHHTFTAGTESVKYYREVVQPDFTLMITATPDDQDAENFRKASGIAVMHRVTVSRLDAVEARLIKGGIKSVAYLAGDQHRELIDFGLAALADGVRVNNAIKAQLAVEGVDLVPLMLVQVASTDKSVDKARKDLMSLGIPLRCR